MYKESKTAFITYQLLPLSYATLHHMFRSYTDITGTCVCKNIRKIMYYTINLMSKTDIPFFYDILKFKNVLMFLIQLVLKRGKT